MATQKSVRLCINPKLSHKRVIHRIGKYLKGTKDKGVIFKPYNDQGLQCYVDSGFAGGWGNADSLNPEVVLSRTLFLMYANYPVIWCSKLQAEITLSTMEANYTAFSQAIREVIPFMNLLKEINQVFPLNLKEPKFH